VLHGRGEGRGNRAFCSGCVKMPPKKAPPGHTEAGGRGVKLNMEVDGVPLKEEEVLEERLSPVNKRQRGRFQRVARGVLDPNGSSS